MAVMTPAELCERNRLGQTPYMLAQVLGLLDIDYALGVVLGAGTHDCNRR